MISTDDPLFLAIQSQAHAHAVGAVAIVGAHALGTATPAAELELFVCVKLKEKEAKQFGKDLAQVLNKRVRLYDVERLPWSSHLHLAAQWLNVSGPLPVVRCPKGARARVPFGGRFVSVPFTGAPHIEETEQRLQPPKKGQACRVFSPPRGGAALVQTSGLPLDKAKK